MKQTNLKNQYVAYYRVSTDKQDLESQRYMLKSFLDEDMICMEFKEIESGKHMSVNEALQSAVAYCKENKKILAVALIDRLGRDAEHALKIHRELDGWMYACNIPTELGSKMDRFTLTLYMAFAEREREIISLRTKQGLHRRMAEGVKMGPKKRLSDKKIAASVSKRRLTMMKKRFSDEKYQGAKAFIVKRVDELHSKVGKIPRKYYSRNFDDVYAEVAEELNSLNVPIPDYLKGQDKWLSSQVLNIYRDETKKVGVHYQFEVVKRYSEEKLRRELGSVLSEEQDSLKSS